MSEKNVTTPRGTWSRRLRLLFLIAILAALLARIGFGAWEQRRLSAETSRLEQKYGDLDGRSVMASSVPSADNRARLVRAAAALLSPGSHDGDFGRLLDGFRNFEKLPLSAALPDDVRALVEDNREALRLADEGRSRRQSSWDTDYGGGEVPPLLNIRNLSDVIYLATVADIDAGRPDGAAKTVASGLAVAASMRQEPNLISQLIRIAVATQQCEGVMRLIVRSEPSQASLEDLARWLVENRDPDPIRLGMLGELRHSHQALLDFERGRVTGASAVWLAPLAWLGRPVIEAGHVRYLQEMDRVLDAEAGTRPRQPFVASPPSRFWDWESRVADIALPGLARSMETGDVLSSTLAATELGVALRRYRLDHGSYPAALTALVPAYLPRVPIDAFTGQPPIYTRVDSGFTLHAQGLLNMTQTHSALDWAVAR